MTKIKSIQGLLLDEEILAEAVHKRYCHNYLKRHKKAYWSHGNYNLLDEETKEIDRDTVRAVIDLIGEKELEDYGLVRKEDVVVDVEKVAFIINKSHRGTGVVFCGELATAIADGDILKKGEIA